MSTEELHRQAHRREITRLIKTLKGFTFPITDYAPFEYAIVTAGGVSCAEGFEHDAPEPFGREHRAQGPFLDAGEELDDGDTSAQAGGDVQGFVVALRLENVFGVVGDIDAHVARAG